VPSVRYSDLTAQRPGEPSSAIKERVQKARDIQKRRFTGDETICNATMNDAQLRNFCRIDEESRKLIEMAIDKLGLSARAHARILKVARTIADLDNSDRLTSSHVAEAIQYRSLDRRLV
jgi:magnesium chelatase family protein